MNNNSLWKNMAMYSIGNIGSKVLSFLIVPFYTYCISMENFGKFDYINTIIFLITPLLTLRINDAAYRYLILSKNENERIKIITNSFVVIITSIVISIIVLSIIFMNESKLKYFIIFQFIVINLKEFYLDVSRGLNKNLIYSICGLLGTFLVLTVNFIGIVILKLDIDAFFIANIVSSLICLILLELKLKLVREKFNFNRISIRFIKDMMKYCIPLIPNFIGWWIITASDRLILKYYVGYEFIAMYAIANKFTTILIMFTSIFDLAWRDSALNILKNKYEHDYFQSILDKLIKFTVSITLILIPFTKILYDIEIIAPQYYDSYWMAILLYISVIFNVLVGYFAVFYLAKSKTKNISISSCIAAIVNIVINVILIPNIGGIGAVVSTILAYFVMFLYRYIDNKHEYNLIIKLKYIIRSSVLLITVMTLTKSDNIIFLIGILLICVIGFVILNKEFFYKIKLKLNKKLNDRSIA